MHRYKRVQIKPLVPIIPRCECTDNYDNNDDHDMLPLDFDQTSFSFLQVDIMYSVQQKGMGPDDIPLFAISFFCSYSNVVNSEFPEQRLDEALALGEMFSPGWVRPGGGAIGRLLPGALLSEPSDSMLDSEDLLSLLKK